MEFLEALAEATQERAARIWVCRDMLGEHVGGPGCFCLPRVVDADDEVGIQALLRASQEDA